MSFASPYLLLGLLAVPLAAGAYLLLERQRERRAAAWVNPALAPNIVQRPSPRLRHLPAALFLIGLTFLLVGFARPQANIKSVREGATVVLTIDTSGSMAATDVKPTRLMAARNAALTFLQVLPTKYRVSLVTFSDHPAVLVAPTYDRDRIRVVLLKLKTQALGTALGDAVVRSTRIAVQAVGPDRPGSPHPPAGVLLISDGNQTSPGTKPDVAAKAARKVGVRVSTVLLGTANGVLKQCVQAPGGFKDCSQPLKVPTDPTALQGIAATTGGRFFQVSSSVQLQKVYKDLGSHQARQNRKREITAAATGVALVFMLAGVVISGLWFRRIA
jgi:Ca-activated chloride channel family protein